jgi:serine/threonine protein kinase/Tfp pilus assembly protein PilF
LVATQIAHYRIIEKLGTGGMGEVFLAQDTKLERRVAVKLLPAKSLDDMHARKRLLREAKAAATLDHPNICSIYEVNDSGDSPFIVMQYVEGKTLFTKLQEAPLTPEEVIDVGIQVAEALAEAHERGVIHRDIKPQNVIITPRGQAKVLDFGLARIAQTAEVDAEAKTDTQLTGEGYIVGTVAYMSPEQLKAMPIDARSDLFSLGATLYECATGKPAFSGNSKIEISSKVLQVDPRKPSHLNPGIPHGLEKIILRAMAKDADTRYQSATEMLEDLKRLRSSLSSVTAVFPSVTRESSGIETPSELTGFQRTVRSRTVQIALAAIVVLGLGAIAFKLWRPAPYQVNSAAKLYFDEGVKAIHLGTYFQASKALKQAVDSDPQYAPAHARLAEAYLEISTTEQARAELLDAVALANQRALATGDKLHLDAIDATARRDFPAAIASYQTLLAQAAAGEKPNAYVDLGRAYERNEQLDNAIENYSQATTLDQQSAGAFLRLGMAYGRRRDQKKEDLKNAEASFSKAEQIYQVLTNNEGQVEVVFQRGMLLYGAGNLPAAKEQFEKALEMAKSQNNPYQITRTELELSLVYRDQGNVEGAKALAADAITIAQNNDIKNVAINGLIDLGLAFMSGGSFDDAGNYFQQALDLARRANSKAGEMRAHVSLARLNFQRSNNDEAIAELKPALDFYRSSGYRRDTSIVLTLLGRAYQDKGEDAIAQKYFEEQFDLVTKAGDDSGIADSHMSLAFLKGINQDAYPEALAHLDEKLKVDDLRKSERGKAFTQMNRGNFLWQLGRYDEARAALDAAFAIATKPESQLNTVIAWVHLVRARIALSQLQYGEAKKEAQLAVDTSAKFPDVQLQAKACLGRAMALSGAAPEGKKLCEEALVAAQNLKSRPLITSTQLALAEAMLAGKDAVAAEQNALDAQKVFAQSVQKDSEWRALFIAARSSDLAGDKTAAQDYAARADKACSELAQKWGADNYESYLRRPDIQLYRTQLAQILKGNK